ncbi:TPA: hypothetical protein N0F65_001606 [Lagenidium giganteum]|uniref:Casein kinase II subunit beta n=1 Tax=Lagenidium giganteum TaxID=4803 RepID=A0AAV2Z6R4_9STRA|nr:TPA: hypothetical protein N0F65_001606 [Lagenidium giganteum]
MTPGGSDGQKQGNHMEMASVGTHATGILKYERVEGKTTATMVYATYPLKFLHPQRSIRSGHDTCVTYILGYGGGLVSGDTVELECSVAPDATVVLCTQATTKVFKSVEGHSASQDFAVVVGDRATLCFVPDPVTCFDGAKYRQKQEFRLGEATNLVFVDWVTGGRQRSFTAACASNDARTETLEHWDFAEYVTATEVYVNDKLIVADRVELRDDEPFNVRQRMYGAHVVGVMVIIGPRVQEITTRLLELSKRKRLQQAQDITPQGRLPSYDEYPGVIASASPLPNDCGTIVRLAAKETESCMLFIKDMLQPLEDLIGFTAYQTTRSREVLLLVGGRQRRARGTPCLGKQAKLDAAREESMSDYEEEDEKWIQWFCALPGNEHFCEVAQSYIEDSFNLYGLRALVPNYQDALNIILDMTDIPYDDDMPAYAAELYGLIHARYILTSHGLDAMAKKYREGDFGVCPRALCDNQPVVPAGLHDEWKKSEMKVFCPKCRDLYTPSTEYQTPAIDGAYFGTTFPHLFFLTYTNLEPPPSTLLYVPRVFGYRIHNKHENRRRLAILAKEDEDEEKVHAQQRRTLAGGRRKSPEDDTDSALRLKKRKQEAATDATLSADALRALQISAPSSANSAQWEDITDVVRAAAGELRVGEIVHVNNFNLFDSMSALELMDPKMDSGMLISGAQPQPMTTKLAAGKIPLSFTSARDVVATIDELFRNESAWLDGQPLAQTLLTSSYIHKEPLHALLQKLFAGPGSDEANQTPLDVTTLASTVLSAEDVAAKLDTSAEATLLLVICAVHVATFKTAHLLRNVVSRADIYEEEDFSFSNALDAQFADSLPDMVVFSLLGAAAARLEVAVSEQKAQAAKKSSNKKKNQKKAAGAAESSSGTYEPLHGNIRISSLLCEILLRRIQLRQRLWEGFRALGVAEFAVAWEDARIKFEATHEILVAMSTEKIELDRECFSGKPIGFDKTISRLLLSGSPPREVKVPTLDQAIALQQRLMKHLLLACATPEWTCMEDLRIFLADLSRQQPSIVVRSYVLLFLYIDKKIYGRFGFMDWLTESMVMNGVPTVLLSTQEGVQFSARTIETVYESLKIYLHGRSRQRARLETLLEDWAILQLEAAGVDETFTTEMGIPKATYPRYFTAWTLEESVLLMIHYVSLGLELDLYSPNEYGTVYWYFDYLLGSRLQNLNVTWTFVEKLKKLAPGPHGSRSSSNPTPLSSTGSTSTSSDAAEAAGKKTKKVANTNSSTTTTADEPPADPLKARFVREVNYTEMLRATMRAYFQFFSALERDELVPAAAPTYGSPTIRFNHRFAPFQSIHFPAALTFEDFAQNSDFAPYKVDVIYKSAEECFKVARVHGEQLLSEYGANMPHADEVRAVIKVAVSNCVNLARREQALLKVSGSASTGRGSARGKTKQRPAPAASDDARAMFTAQFDFTLHPHFPVVQFVEQQPQQPPAK